jgi:alkanesulfonate monooxygenase SsuD/methylene tetrahydromethanopterin reductase-like flavin-dependent oxidoreductase (luciferase family)
VLTAQAITVDHASQGRLDLALGNAWFEDEHHALGIPFPGTGARFDLMEDTLEIATRLMTGERVSYEGKVVSLVDAQMRPVPVQQPHPPILIGGQGPKRTLPLVARYADRWHCYGGPKQLAGAWERIGELAEEAGRSASDIERVGSLSLSDVPVEEILRLVGKWEDAGWDHLICGWPGEGRERIEEFAAAVGLG